MPEENLINLKKFIDQKTGLKNIHTVIELGARDCRESLFLSDIMPKANIFSFECNEATLPYCIKNIANNKRIKLIQKAVSDVDGTLTFYAIDQKKTKTTWHDGNPGASSLFKASGKYPVENYVQKEVTVLSTRLDTFLVANKLKKLDLLWMDIQGAELQALKGLGTKISCVKYIHTEVEFMEIYKDQPLFKDIRRYLNKHGFYLYKFTSYGDFSADAVFVNELNDGSWKPYKLARNYLVPLIYSMLPVKRAWNARLQRIRRAKTIYFGERKFPHNLNRASQMIWYKKLAPSIKKYEAKKTEPRVDVVIPAIRKDIATLKMTIQGCRENLEHRVGDVYIVAPKDKKIEKICKETNAHFINEVDSVPIRRAEIDYICGGIDRSGWLFQQLIKLNADMIAKTSNFIVLDADTVWVKPIRLISGDKYLYPISDEYHLPYYYEYKRLFGKNVKSNISFVSHYMLMNRKILREMKSAIEHHTHKSWYDAIVDTIDRRELSAFSEYETYGNYMLDNYPEKISRVFYSNASVDPDKINDESVLAEYASKNMTLSFHVYESRKEN